jgi:hypothetical protein
MSDTILAPGLLRVIHPLDDAPEQKLYHAGIGYMPMTATVRIALLTLRLYLLGMVVLVAWRVLSTL